MKTAARHPDESRRLRSVRELGLIDTDSEERFDRLTELTSIVMGVPIALISLVHDERQWFKSRIGLDDGETPRESSFCAHAILEDDGEAFVVEDATLDCRFFANPLVTGDPGIRFYAGQVVHGRDGMPVGTLCAIGREPRRLGEDQRRALAHLAALVEREFERSTERRASADLVSSEETKSLILESISEGVVLTAADGRPLEWNSAADRMLGLGIYEKSGIAGDDPRWTTCHEDGSICDADERPPAIAARTGSRVDGKVIGIRRQGGARVWLRVTSQPIFADDGTVTQMVSTFADATVEVEERHQRERLTSNLQRSQHLAHSALEALEQGLILTDNAGNISLANSAATRLLGYTREEFTDLWSRGEWHSYDPGGRRLRRDELPVTRAMTSGDPVNGQIVAWRRSDGELILVRVSCSPNADGDGAMLVTFADVTAEYRSRQLLDATLEMAPAGLVIIDDAGKMTRANPAFARHVGRDAGDLVGQGVGGLLHPDDLAGIRHRHETQRAAPGDAHSFDHRVVHPDGTEVWLNTQIAVVPGERPLTIAATFEITERRRLLMDVSRFRYLFDHSHDMITVIDTEGNVLYASPATERILGYPNGHRTPNGIYDLIHPDDVDEAVAAVDRLMRLADDPEPFTARTQAMDGQWLHIEYSAANLLDEPTVEGILIIGRDVSQRVLLTDQLEHRAGHDMLTDLPNRRLLENNLDTALARARRENKQVAMCFVDLDGFKAVNDELGHAAGDDLLIQVADRLRSTIRSGDTAARMGGDEFVVLLDPVSSAEHAIKIASRIDDALALLTGPEDDRPTVGASIGLTLSRASDDSSSILQRADEAMYRAKAQTGFAIEVVAAS